jgi:D-serine deaminase-like pyridoxal phosphate-dependent protein
VSCGGTGTYQIAVTVPGVTEVQAGGGIFGDVHYRKHYGVEHEQALTILTTVASRPTPTRLVCDAGWKSMAVYPTPPVPSGLGEVRSLNVSAEHATIELAEAAAIPEIGDRLEFVCGYGDSTLFLHDELYGVRDGRVETAWAILGRGKTR